MMKRLFSLIGVFVFVVLMYNVSLAGVPYYVNDDDNAAECNNQEPDFSTIQAAVDGVTKDDIIYVCPGVYDEQVRITDRRTIIGFNGAIVRKTDMASNAADLLTGTPVAAAIFADTDYPVSIEGIIIDGINSNIASCRSTNLVGIFYKKASGQIKNIVVKNMKYTGGLQDCRGGIGIFVQNNTSTLKTTTIEGNSIHDYNWAGVVAQGITSARITKIVASDNTIVGDSSNQVVSQFGIRISDNATGTLNLNHISNHFGPSCTPPSTSCTTVGANILLNNARNVVITNNILMNAQVGIYLVRGVQNTIQTNKVYNSSVDGIALEGTSNINKINTTNVISETAGDAIRVLGYSNAVKNNTINEADIGVYYKKGGIFNPNIVSGNSYFNSVINKKVQ